MKDRVSFAKWRALTGTLLLLTRHGLTRANGFTSGGSGRGVARGRRRCPPELSFRGGASPGLVGAGGLGATAGLLAYGLAVEHERGMAKPLVTLVWVGDGQSVELGGGGGSAWRSIAGVRCSCHTSSLHI